MVEVVSSLSFDPIASWDCLSHEEDIRADQLHKL